MCYQQPANCLGQWCIRQMSKRARCRFEQPITFNTVQPSRIIRRGGVCHASQPLRIVIFTNKRFKKSQRHPLVPVLVTLLQLSLETHLKSTTSFTEIVQQRSHCGQQLNIFTRVPVVLVLAA